MTHKTVSILFTSLCLIVILGALRAAQAQPSKPIKIGLMYDLTGIYSAMGQDAQNGAMTWIEWINSEGGIKGHPIKVVSLDGQSDPTKAALTVNKLIEVEKVHVIGGCNGTGVALAVGPVCEAKKVPFLTATGSEVFEYTLKPHWSFRSTPGAWEMVDWGFGAMKKLDPKFENVSILYQGAAFGKSLYDMAVRYAPMWGLKIVAAEKYDPAGTDFGAQISSIMKANPDFVAIYCADMAGALAIKQMREMGMTKPVVSNGGLNMKSIRDAFKDTFSIPPYVYPAGLLPDVWWQLPNNSPDYKILAPIATRYEKKYKDQYAWFQHVSVNSMWIIKDSIERALNDDSNLLDRDLQTIRTSIRDKVETTKDLRTGGGIMMLTPTNHNAPIPGSAMATFHWENGKVVYDQKLSDITLNPPPPVPK